MRIVRHYEHGGPSVLRVEETEKPVPAPGEVLIRTEAVGVNFAECQRRQGIAVGGPADLPGSPGGDVAGVVESVGEGVVNVAPGDRVVAGVGSNAYAEYVVNRSDWLFTIPQGIGAGPATSLPIPGQTAYHVIATAGQLQPGQSVLVHAAAGGVGHLLVQLAKALGAGTVIATASSPEKLEFAKSLGADLAYDYSQEGWDEEILTATKGEGVDLVLETVGGDILSKSVPLIRQFGRMVVYGSAGGEVPSVDIADLFDNKTVLGFSMWGLMYRQPEVMAAGAKALLDLVGSGKVRPVVHAEVPLDDAAKAHEMMEARAQMGRVVLIP
ncbi:quinone oxidoreductase family protein [Streptomyces sp. H39-S7]|uniref:quinone oxidoreductase family protein n=1 Tax=Streptomyces sp. H39-S7 TaxID=3004357 RepID=UPI0022AFF0BD|nr:zinc-binding dehydrogenase [Streptomyces sp. H39-S7]MCZ4125482.1 zinc-binding dehydrogenase [Streptomyces sp. H39-S7]